MAVTIASQSVVRINPVTGQVVDTYELPDENVSFSGIVFDDSNMYLMGTTSFNEGVIYRIARP